MSVFQRITMNLKGAELRHETLEGEDYLVVPTVMLTEGVHKGNQGPLLYLNEELGKNLHSWNHKPVIIYHPGTDVNTACDPLIVEKQRVGLMFNTEHDGRLKTEAWLKTDKLKTVDNRVYTDLMDSKMVEVSTGLYHDLEEKSGEWTDGTHYDGIVRNMMPDHLAILPDEKGACSVEKGAGMLRNAAKTDDSGPSLDDIRGQISALLREDRKSPEPMYSEDYCYITDVYSKFAVFEAKGKCYKVGYKVKAGKVTLEGEPEEVRKVTSYVTANGEMTLNTAEQVAGYGKVIPDKLYPNRPTHDNILDAIRKYNPGKVVNPNEWMVWLREIEDGYVVYSDDKGDFRLSYTNKDGNIVFGGEPQQIERIVEYKLKTTPHSQEGNRDKTSEYQLNQQGKSMAGTNNTIHQGAHELIHNPESPKQSAHNEPAKTDGQVRTTSGGGRKEEVSKMISGGKWKEEDRSFLEGLPDDHFKKVQGATMEGATQEVTPYSYQGIGDRSNAHTANRQQEPKQMTENEYISQAPPGIRDVLQDAVDTARREKGQLIQTITANKANVFNPKWLEEQNTRVLRGLAALAGASQRQGGGGPYTGQAGGGGTPMFIENAQRGDDDEKPQIVALPIPTMNFDAEERETA